MAVLKKKKEAPLVIFMHNQVVNHWPRRKQKRKSVGVNPMGWRKTPLKKKGIEREEKERQELPCAWVPLGSDGQGVLRCPLLRCGSSDHPKSRTRTVSSSRSLVQKRG